MAAFITAVVSAVQAVAAWVGTSFIAKTVFNIAASYVVSRLINKSSSKSKSKGTQQGGRVQLPPQTNNHIPILYGSAFINGIITDARLVSTDNKTNNVMYYCLVLSELTNTGTVGVDNIYWSDVRLIFETTNTDTHKVLKGVKTIDTTDDYEDTNFKDGSNNLIQIRVYAGNTESAQQIFPQNNKVNAYDFWPSDSSNRQYWNNAEYGGKINMQGLVFAIIRMEYNQEKGMTGLPNVTFKLNNTLNNPADVWLDYMTSNRYGANIDTAQINTTELNAWRTYCNQYYNSGTNNWQNTVIGGQRPRYQINGIIDTGNPVKNNIDQILQNSAAWMSYDISRGLWRVYPQAEQTATLTFDDDNIVGGIQLSSTNLEDLYNQLEVEYCDTTNFDQRLYARDSVPVYDANNPSGTRHPNEPDNKLSMTLDLINNNVQALRVGRIQLKQTRDDLVIQFTAAHQALQTQAGDVILVKNSLYNWNTGAFAQGKPFRVTRVKEIETQDGALVVEITALEYNADVYTEEPVNAFEPSANVGISPIVNIAVPTTPTITVSESGLRPKITVNGQVPAGVVESVEFWITFDVALTETSRKYNLIRVLRPSSGGTYTTGTALSFDFDSLDSSNLIVKYRGVNRIGAGPFSTPSATTTFTPKTEASVIGVNTQLLDANGNPVGDLSLPDLLSKVSDTFTAADGNKSLTDKVFEEFTQKTGFDIVKAATDGSLTGTSGVVVPEPSYTPTITNVTPTTVDYLGGTTVTVTGTLFIPDIQGATIVTELLWRDVVTATVSVTNTQIVFLAPARDLGFTSTIKVRTKATRNGIQTTYTSAAVTVTSIEFKDLQAVNLYPPTRSRTYNISEQALNYVPAEGSYFISFSKDRTIKKPVSYSTFALAAAASNVSGVNRGEFARVGGTSLLIYDGTRFVTYVAKTYTTINAMLADVKPTQIGIGQYARIQHASLNSDENNRIYRWTGSSWVYEPDIEYAVWIRKFYEKESSVYADFNPGVRYGEYAMIGSVDSTSAGKLFIWLGNRWEERPQKFKNLGFNYTIEQPLVANQGSARLYRADGTLYDEVTYQEIIINQNIVELPFKTRELGVDYYILMDRGLVKSADLVLSAAYKTNTNWTFTTELFLGLSPYVLGSIDTTGYNTVAPTQQAFGSTDILYYPRLVTPKTDDGFEVYESVVLDNLGNAFVKKAKLTLTFMNKAKILSGNILIKKYSDDSLVTTIPATSCIINNAGQFEYPEIIPNLQPNTRYKVQIPQGIVALLSNDEQIAVNGPYEYMFKTYPKAELLKYELDNVTVDYIQPNVNDPARKKINLRSNIKFTFGRRFFRTINDNELYVMTGATNPADIGIGSTPPTGAILRLFRKERDQIVEIIDFDKTFSANNVGVQYNNSLGVITINFTKSFDPDTEYYILFNTLVYDQYWQVGTAPVTDSTKITWATDGVKVIENVGIDKEIERGYLILPFSTPVVPGYGVLRVIDETTNTVIDEFKADQEPGFFHDFASNRGVPESKLRTN